MKTSIFCLIILLFIFQGCATPSYISSSRGTIRLGMTKMEVSLMWGEPIRKTIFDEPDRKGRYELWSYSRVNWWGAHTILLSFNKGGALIEIEPLYK